LTIKVGDIAEDLVDLRGEMNTRFDAVDARFDAMDARFNAIDARFDTLERTILSAILQRPPS
jgi:hypothetical protein